MTFEVLSGICAASLLLALLSFVAQWLGRVRNHRELAVIREAFEKQSATSREELSGLKRDLLALDETVRTPAEPPPPPKSGSLNRSVRAQALQLLRSGMSPDTVAASLGMGKRETRLLERVSRTFCVH